MAFLFVRPVGASGLQRRRIVIARIAGLISTVACSPPQSKTPRQAVAFFLHRSVQPRPMQADQ
ncbi:hypothetical protein [Burkholderia sp. Nafp2/4-1b]|uniref:hypothetical protein n=1 Tax=Burkholderia sp. Nafp2/4-1b TaxID=2116686 RepID=UPI0013CE7D62|nr:hypothetical protein [Burkholderia sp. Nafp2/4-1b]